jgi:hypothetical protein
MIAALTLAVLYAISVLIVRFASVVLRHTGLPDNVARFQSISAISGSGFTTSESEKILTHPQRRRVITWLMIIGNLGLASVAATLIVTFVGKDGNPAQIAIQAALILAAVAATIVVTNNGALDRWMCGLIATMIAPAMDDHPESYERMLLMDNDQIVARHVVSIDAGTPLRELWPDLTTLKGLTIRVGPMDPPEDFSLETIVRRGTEIICFGSRDAHHAFQTHIAGANVPEA